MALSNLEIRELQLIKNKLHAGIITGDKAIAMVNALLTVTRLEKKQQLHGEDVLNAYIVAGLQSQVQPNKGFHYHPSTRIKNNILW